MKESFITHSYHWLMIHSVLSEALLLLFNLPILQISLKLHMLISFKDFFKLLYMLTQL